MTSFRSNGHSVRCARAARTTPEQCKCVCNGDFHGGSHTERARALVWDSEKRLQYSARQVAAAKRKARDTNASSAKWGAVCTDLVATYAVDELVLSQNSTDQEIVSATIAAIVTPFIDEIVNAPLSDNDSRQIETVVNDSHVLCSLCVAILKIIEATHALAASLANDVADDITTSLGKDFVLSGPIRMVLREALRRSFDAIVSIVADPAKVKVLQLIGLVMCPDISKHSDIERYCVQPLVGEFVTTILYEWVKQRFPSNSSLLFSSRTTKSTSRTAKHRK